MSRFYKLKMKDKPKWYEFRRKFASRIVDFARWVYPQSPEVWAFHTELLMDAAVYGKAVVRVDPLSFEGDLVLKNRYSND